MPSPSLEQRLLVLEREVAFLKSQGLSRAEMDGVLTAPRKGLAVRRHWLQCWLFLLSGLVFMICVRVFMPTAVEAEGEKSHKKVVVQPEPSESFALPSADN